MEFFNIAKIPVQVLQIDHSEAFLNAGKSAFPGVKPVICWPHVVRSVDKNAKLLKDKSFLATVKKNVDSMHLTRSKPQMQALWKVVKVVSAPPCSITP